MIDAAFYGGSRRCDGGFDVGRCLEEECGSEREILMVREDEGEEICCYCVEVC